MISILNDFFIEKLKKHLYNSIEIRVYTFNGVKYYYRYCSFMNDFQEVFLNAKIYNC